MKNDNVNALIKNVSKVIAGKKETISNIIICLLCEGHILIEDVPGVGKTTLVKALAKSLNTGFKRIQFTPDLLPSDIIGVSIYDKKLDNFRFVKGPIFGSVILADEINRTSPKTQASLLECMQERKITVEGKIYELPEPFMILATQNPIEYEGTFPLPEAQLDRFIMKISIGYPDKYSERTILERFKYNDPLLELSSVIDKEDIKAMQEDVKKVHVNSELYDYIVDIVTKTRNDANIRLGVSPRGSLALLRAAQARAYINNRNYVLPDDVKQLANPIFNHRIILTHEAKIRGITKEACIKSIINTVKIPVVNQK
ncbi:AAA family ATPase [Abyssisolibacter fermentans]|uniref:AAA family ATPase n=1 Tax=Abyssisolibacter fermentans TaxID=1766203 RepID=UPI00082C071B|nr:MoxR family ATPase [Abyssisolibacter fermentans]